MANCTICGKNCGLMGGGKEPYTGKNYVVCNDCGTYLKKIDSAKNEDAKAVAEAVENLKKACNNDDSIYLNFKEFCDSCLNFKANKEEKTERIKKDKLDRGLLYDLEGVRGRHIEIYERKCVITTTATMGSVMTGNATDGEKTIFYPDVVGVQFKKSGVTIGYLQFETSSAQMNNQASNTFSENTFTFEAGKNGITNEMMEDIYKDVVDRIEAIKYKMFA